MHRTPHPHGPSLGRPAVALVSVLALLAFACFPVLAQAETVYENESTTLPGSGGGKSPTQKNPVSHESSPGAHSSGAPGGNGGSESTPGSSQSQNTASKEGNPSTPGGGGQPQGKEAKGASGGKKQAGGGVQHAKPLATTTSADDDSPSPLVPILIAVAVLAAISVGAVLVRQRRGSGGLFSPKAS